MELWKSFISRGKTAFISCLTANKMTLIILGLMILCSNLFASENELMEELKPLTPYKAILQAFDRFPIVAIGEAHGMNEESEFIRSLIQHPEFTREVHRIVLEAGNARYQDALDRYVSGEPVSLEELRNVWRNHTCSALGPMDSPNLQKLLSTIRDINQILPIGMRLQVLAGDPPVDWDEIQSEDDLLYWMEQRDKHYAHIVENEVLAKGQKALLIIGGAHLDRNPPPDNDPGKGVMLQILEAKHPGKTFVIIPHEGFDPQNEPLEARLSSLPIPSLILLKDTWLGKVKTSASGILDVMLDKDGKLMTTLPDRRTLEDKADAYLYLGPVEKLTMEQRDPAMFLDDAYFNELNRRHKIAHGRELDREELMKPRPERWLDNFKIEDQLIPIPSNEGHN